MKKILCCFLLLLPALAISVPSFAQTGKRKAPSKKITAKSTRSVRNKLTANTKADKSGSFRADRFIRITEEQSECVKSNSGYCSKASAGTTKDCSTGYCKDDDCIRKIVCCHELDSVTFQEIIKGSGWYAEFSYSTISGLKRQADCALHKFKFSSDADSFYIEVVDIDTAQHVAPLSYYSTGLIMGILKNKFSYITVYTGISLSNGREIIPFEVHTGTKTYYYDLSDTAP